MAQINDSRKSKLNIGLSGRAPLAVNEAGLYDLVLQSRKPEAVKFKEWVTGTVLPAIRNMLEDLGEDVLKFERIYLDAYGREKPCFHLPRFGDISPTVMDGLSRSP